MSKALYEEWKRSTDTEEGGAYIVNRYGEGSAGNPVFAYDRETVEALIDAALAEAEKRIAELEAALDKALGWWEHSLLEDATWVPHHERVAESRREHLEGK